MQEVQIEQYFNILSQCPLFKDILLDDYHRLLGCINGHMKLFSPGEYVFLSGDEVNYVGVVLQGSLELSKENPAGDKHIIDFLGPSNVFGEGIVCTTRRVSPVTVLVKENSRILMIPYERLIKSCGNSCSFHFQLIKNMMMLLGEKNFSLTTKMELILLKGMREKLSTFLLRESARQQKLTFQIIPNRNELAEHLNVSRTSMCRELARMKEEGIIDYYQNTFKILDRTKLKECLKHS